MRRSERGEGKAGLLFSIVFLAVAGYVMFHWMPARIDRAKLRDFMEEQAKFAAGNSAEKAIARSILDKCVELGIPVDKKLIKVAKSRERIRLEVSYTVPFAFPGYTYAYKVTEVVDRPFFIF